MYRHIEHYSAIRKTEIPPFVRTYMNFKYFMLRVINWIDKYKYHTFSFIYERKQVQIQETIVQMGGRCGQNLSIGVEKRSSSIYKNKYKV